MVERRVLVDAQRLHHALHPLGAEQTHDVVRERDVKAALAGVALTTGTTAQLVVNAAGLVPLGADDIQAAGLAHAVGLGVDALFVLRHALSKQSAGLEDLLVLSLGVAGGLGDDLLGEAGLTQVRLGQILRVAAEHDIRAAAGHVRRDRDGAELTGLRDDLGLFLVVLGVEDVVRDTRFTQQL